MFHIFSFIQTLNFLVLARNWRGIMIYWWKIESVFLRRPYRYFGDTMSLKIWIIGLTSFILYWGELDFNFHSTKITVNRGGFTQNLKFNYLYKSHCKSNKQLWALYNITLPESPQHFVEYAVTLVKIIEF
jgi:hypothetical protein